MATIIPHTRNVQRVGLARELVRITTVEINATVACTGAPLHLAHGLKFKDGSNVDWFVSDADARRFGWV